jgi:hypothetical protein
MAWSAPDGGDTSNLASVLAFAGAAMTAVATLVSAVRWPTLRRRLREHADLIKDLPADHARPLNRILQAEVEELARRDAKRLDLREAERRNLWRATGLTVGILATLLLIGGGFGTIDLAGKIAGVIFFVLIAGLFFLLLFWILFKIFPKR